VAGSDETRRIIIGLGNPGRKYRDTRHNVGFMVVGELVGRLGLSAGRSAFEGELHDARPTTQGESRRVALFQPMTFMNRSGRAVSELVRFYKAEPNDLLVVYDDLALPVGALRARPGGSAGGHNGLKDIIQALGTQDVPRLRVGIGSPPGRMDSADYVLQRFNKEQKEEIGVSIQQAADAAMDWVFNGIDYVMQKHNRKGETTGNE